MSGQEHRVQLYVVELDSNEDFVTLGVLWDVKSAGVVVFHPEPTEESEGRQKRSEAKKPRMGRKGREDRTTRDAAGLHLRTGKRAREMRWVFFSGKGKRQIARSRSGSNCGLLIGWSRCLEFGLVSLRAHGEVEKAPFCSSLFSLFPFPPLFFPPLQSRPIHSYGTVLSLTVHLVYSAAADSTIQCRS